MNTVTKTLDTQAYRDQMQRAALAFLHRHQAEHLGDDTQLIERATDYLTRALEVPLFMASTLVERAFLQLSSPTWVGIDLAESGCRDDICLIDCRNGSRTWVHRRLLPGAFLARFTTP